MSFSGEVKSELTAIKTEKSCCMLSELNALTQGCASMTLHGHGEFSISYATENPSVAMISVSSIEDSLILSYLPSPITAGVI